MNDPVRTDMYCHACRNDFTATMDMALNGNHEIECPHCGHIHYRVVEGGVVTGERYRSSMQTYYSATTTTTLYLSNTGGSTANTGAGSYFLADSWAQTGATP